MFGNNYRQGGHNAITRARYLCIAEASNCSLLACIVFAGFRCLQVGHRPVLVTCALQKFAGYIPVPVGWTDTCIGYLCITEVSTLYSSPCRVDIDLYWLPVHYKRFQAIFQFLQGGYRPILVTCALQKLPNVS